MFSISAVTDTQGLTDLSHCAHALGMAFSRQALDEPDIGRKVQFVELFNRCFHGFRVAVALKMRLAQAARTSQRDLSEADDLHDRPDPTDRDRPERDRPERDRPERDRIEYDRDREAASLPILLKTLGGVVTEAEALPGPPPAELPTLSELLARMGAKPAPAAQPRPPAPKAAAGAVAVLSRPPPAPASARSRLLLGAAAPLQVLPKARRSTGPP